MTEPCADYRSNKQGVKKRVKQFLVYVLLSEEASEEVESEYEAGNEKQGIPPDFKTEDMKQHGIDVPIDK